jgi:hypothetical protein
MVRGLSLVLCGCAVAKRINFRYMIDGLVGEESALGRRLYIAREKEKRGRERNAKAEQVSRG